MEQKTHWKKLVNPDYLGSYSLMDSGKAVDMIAKISHVTREQVKGEGGKSEECTIAHLVGQKPMILNRTNCKIITKLLNTPFIEDWKNHSICIYVTTTKVKGEVVECLRIREQLPITKTQLNHDHKKWEGAKKSLIDGNVTIEEIEKVYYLTAEIKQELCNLLK